MTCHFGDGIVVCTNDGWRVDLNVYCPWCREVRRCLKAAVFGGWCGNDYKCGTCGTRFSSEMDGFRKQSEEDREKVIAEVAAHPDPQCWTCHDTGDTRLPDMPPLHDEDLEPKPCTCTAGLEVRNAI